MPEFQTCSACKTSKPHEEFYFWAGAPVKRCKECIKECARKYRATPRGKELSKRRDSSAEKLEYSRQYENRPDVMERRKVERFKRVRSPKFRLKINTRRQTDPEFRLSMQLRCRLNCVMRTGAKGGSTIRDMGCSVAELKTYLEYLFWPGMTWANQGKKGWVVDHVIPLKAFNLLDREDFLKAVNFRNLQPLWDTDNMIKRARLDWTPAESKFELPERLK